MHIETRRLPRLAMLLAALTAALALTACGSSGSGSGGSGSAQTLIKQTFSGSHSVRSGVLAFALTLDPSGSSTLTTPLSLSLSGPFQSRGTGKLPASDFKVNISALGHNGSLGVISTGTSGYVTLQGTSYQLPKADFQRLDSSFSSVESSSGNGSKGLSAFGINPQHWLQNPTIVGSETVGGAATTHVRSGVNVTALLSDLNTFLAKTAKTTGTAGRLPSSIPAATAQKIAGAIKGATIDIWTGTADKTLRKLSLNLRVPVTGQISSLLGGLNAAGIGLTLQYANLNQPQTISAPSNVQPYSQFTTKLRSVVSALEGGLAGGGASTGSSGQSSTTGTSSNVQKYSQCIQSAGQDVRKMQKCASLLNGK
ncbi:MAG: hypothetical protein WBQ18_05440 [Solirubrobacteraceae bacterium]